MTYPVMPDAARLAARSASLAASRLGITRPAARARVRAAAAIAAGRLAACGHGDAPWLQAIIDAVSRQEETNTMPDQTGPIQTGVNYTRASAEAAACLEELLSQEAAGVRLLLETGPYTALMVVCALRLAMRHPGVSEDIRIVLGAYADQWSVYYAGTAAGPLAAEGIMPQVDLPGTGLN